MTTEVNDELAFLSKSFSVYNHFVPQQDAMEPAKANPRRRRQRKNKDGDDALKKRKLSENQVKLLEQSFGSDHNLETERKERLATEIGLHPRQVAVWFQNRRARWKKQRAEEEYFKLKAEHENTVVEKCILEAQVIKLRDQLAEAQKELWDIGLSSNSIGDSGLVEGVENNVFYMPDDSYVSGFEWDNLYLM